MKTRIIQIAMIAGLSVFLFSSCQKDIESMKPQNEDKGITTMDQLSVANDFNWKTTQDVELNLTAGTTATVVIKSSADVVYQKALLIPGEPYNSVLTLPTYEKELTLVFNGNSVPVKIVNKNITYSF